MDAYQKIHIKAVNEGSLKDTYLLTKGKRVIRRARVLGTIVGKYKNEDGSYAALTLDDGSDTIRVKAFREDVSKVEPFDIGQQVDVFGRVRDYDDERYLLPDLIHRVEDPNFPLLRNAELTEIAKAHQARVKEFEKKRGKGDFSEDEMIGFSEEEPQEVIEESIEDSPAPTELVLSKIVELDEGEGVEYESLLKITGLESQELEDALTQLLNKGDVYEPKSGRFKRLA